jgi:hypothetical protein
VVVYVVVLVVVFVTVVVCASLHPDSEKSSEAEITTVKRMALVFFSFTVSEPPVFVCLSLMIYFFYGLEIS